MILFAAALLLPWCAGAAAPEKGAVPVIFETDMGNDIDDALALDLLYKGMDAGHIRLIGVSLNKRSSTSFEFIDLMNTWYGYPVIPIAYTPRAVDNTDRDYTTPVCELKASDGKPLFKRSRKPGSWEDPVAMYRRLLAAEPDNSVVVVSVGFSGNLAALLASDGDDVSPLTGRELVARKVKYFSVMAGSFGVKKRAEYNVINDIPAARKFFAECPSPIVLTPFEIGKQVVYPGRSIAEDFGWAEHHPMVEAYKAYHEMPYDRPTWDVIATYYVLPHEPSSLTLSIPGRITVDEQGFIFFTPDKAGQHRYITASDRQAGMILGYFLRALPERPLRYMR